MTDDQLAFRAIANGCARLAARRARRVRERSADPRGQRRAEATLAVMGSLAALGMASRL